MKCKKKRKNLIVNMRNTRLKLTRQIEVFASFASPCSCVFACVGACTFTAIGAIIAYIQFYINNTDEMMAIAANE